MIKKLGLFIFGLVSLGLINFSSATNYTCSDNSFTITEDSYLILNKFTGRSYLEIGNMNNGTCFSISFSSSGLGYGSDCIVPSSFPIILTSGTYYIDCSYSVSSFSIVPAITSCPTCPTCPTCDYSDYELKSDITENYCKNKFSSLMTSSECDSLYSGYVSSALYENCTNSLNSCSGQLGICNSSLNSCLNGNYSGDIQRSSIWINNIQHLGNKNIFIDIPEEISWDYLYTGDNMNIDVEGYNVDTEYISGIISTQSSLPNQVDLNNLVKVILPLFVPGLVIILFIYFVFRFIKKIF